MNERIKTIVSEFRQRLQQLYGNRLEQVILFGSQARGDAVEGSDIDVMIVLKGDVNVGDEISRTTELCAELSLAYDVLISTIFMSAYRFTSEQSPLLINVHREGVAI
jgi:uncharacterized protein